MVEYVSLEKKPNIDKKIIEDRDRVYLLIFSYILNFNLYLTMFITYESIIMSLVSFILMQYFLIEMLVGNLNIGKAHILGLLFLILNGIFLKFGLFVCWFNLFVVIINYFYFKYLVYNKQRIMKEISIKK